MIRPITTEKAVRLIELNNTLFVEVDRRDSKTEIKKEFEDTFNVKVDSVNTLTAKNRKYAYIKLNKKNLE